MQTYIRMTYRALTVFLLVSLFSFSIHAAGDTTPPVRSNGSPSRVLSSDTTQATLSIATNESATCKYSTAANVTYSSMLSTFSSTGGNFHSEVLTGLTSGLPYKYYIRCQDASGNQNGDDFLILFSVAAGTTSIDPDADFQRRCSAPGVTSCQGFDSLSSIQYNFSTGQGFFWNGINPTPDQANHILDAGVKTSGSGSIKLSTPDPEYFKYAPQGSKDGAGVAGQVRISMGRSFDSGDTFYLQWRIRFDQNMLNITSTNSGGGAGFKQIILHYNSSTCAATELTFTNNNFSGYPTWYTACGARSVVINVPPGEYHYQQADYFNDCTYNNRSGCWHYRADEWETMYWKVRIGNYDQPNSRVEGWAARGNQPFEKIFDKPDMVLSSSGPYNNITLTPYMNSRGSSSTPTNPEGHVWYDEIIVSTQPIPAPAGNSYHDSSLPAAPSKLTITGP